MRYFNTEGCCKPDEHYMVDLSERLAENIICAVKSMDFSAA